jgi:cytochrome c biogenesis protein
MRLARTLPDARAAGARLRLADLGSLRLTLWLLGLLAGAVAAGYHGLSDATWALAAPLALLAINLAAAVATHPTFRSHGALVVFHVALFAIIVLAAASRLTYLKGAVELSDGQLFEGALTQRESGPLHRGALDQLRFANLGFEVDYQPGMRRAQTRNRVLFVDANGIAGEAQIGDATPLRLGDYRFYTSPNKGFAPDLTWTPNGAAPVRGTIHMPSFPAQLTRQTLEWTPPGGSRVLHVQLDLGDYAIDLAQDWTLRRPPVHALTIRIAGESVTLRPGESHRFAEGTLRYEGLRMWMGYTVSYDWTMPWLFAAGLLAVAALACHFAGKFRRVPWLAAGEEEGA